jgi:hypothetical protein
MSVSQADAQTVLKMILRTFAIYVCQGHESTAPCNGMCVWEVASKSRETKTYAEMDATPTLCDHEHEELRPGSWSIFWEGGNAPDEWVFSEKLAENVRRVTDNRVFIEPINGCVLGVYPA